MMIMIIMKRSNRHDPLYIIIVCAIPSEILEWHAAEQDGPEPAEDAFEL